MTSTKGDDGEMAFVRYNSGFQKRMRHARKHCLDEAHKWAKSLRHLPTRDEWLENPKMFAIDTVEELFGSFDNMLEKLEAKVRPKPLGDDYLALRDSLQEQMRKRARKESAMAKGRKYTEESLAEALVRAFKEQSTITSVEYESWRNSLSDRANVPSGPSIRLRLGQGSWPRAVERARELMGDGWPVEIESEATPAAMPEIVPGAVSVDGAEEVVSEVVPETKKTGARGLSDEQCFEDVRRVAEIIDDSPTKKQYMEHRRPGAMTAKGLAKRFHGWDNVLTGAGLELTMGAKRSQLQKTAPSSEDKFVVSDSLPLDKSLPLGAPAMPDLPGYRFVNLLANEYKIGKIPIQQSDVTAIVKVQETFALDGEEVISQDKEINLCLIRNGQEFDMPEPEENVFYLIDNALCQMIPAEHWRDDLVPVHQSRDDDADNSKCSTFGLYL